MQKTALTLFLSLIIGCTCFAQNCRNYYYLQNNKTVELTIYNKKGAENGKQVYTVSNVQTTGGTTKANLNSEMFDKKGKSIAKGASVIQCTGGVMMIDMKMMMPQAQQEQFSKAEAKAENVFIEYPASMKVGEQLKDGNLTMELTNNGMQQTVSMLLTNRKIEDKESITTTAGTWECFKISFKSKLTIKTMGIGIPVNLDGTEWFAPGFGIIKTESKYGSTAVTSIK